MNVRMEIPQLDAALIDLTRALASPVNQHELRAALDTHNETLDRVIARKRATRKGSK